MAYCYSPQANQFDGVMRPMNPLETGGEGYLPVFQSWTMAGIDDAVAPMVSPLIRSDVATPTVDILKPEQFQMPALNGGLGAVQDALQVLSIVDLLARG